MRKRFDPSDLEPKNGDFANFVEKLNEKSVRELKALQVNDELMREQINDELNGAASNVWSSPNLDQSAPKHRDTVTAQIRHSSPVEGVRHETTSLNHHRNGGEAHEEVLLRFRR